MFLRVKRRFKDGKEHRYWSIVENHRTADSQIVQRHVLYLGEIESPWLEAIEIQDSAFPYHDWNERIAAECYAANAASRLWDTQGRIAQLVNNYASISFDFGPTVLLWMQKYATEAYEAILWADRKSLEKYSGHGNALAQAYNHMILPLANSRDKKTQITWGIGDFEFRFGRKPEGLWLPETAVDLESLDLMAQFGIGLPYWPAAGEPRSAHRWQ